MIGKREGRRGEGRGGGSEDLTYIIHRKDFIESKVSKEMGRI